MTSIPIFVSVVLSKFAAANSPYTNLQGSQEGRKLGVNFSKFTPIGHRHGGNYYWPYVKMFLQIFLKWLHYLLETPQHQLEGKDSRASTDVR